MTADNGEGSRCNKVVPAHVDYFKFRDIVSGLFVFVMSGLTYNDLEDTVDDSSCQTKV